MIIRQASSSQFPAVRAFYHSVIDGIADDSCSVGWMKDIYPAPDYLKESIINDELFIAMEGEKIIAAMVLNHACNEGYHDFQWPTDAADEEVTVIHALCVHPSRFGQGYAKKMVRFAIENAKRNNQKAIRLDVLKGNVAAEKLYDSIGFQYLHTLPMFYEDTGWTEFELYEYAL